ncbi:hypothetical protein B4U79_09360 [Dinothrombium tinctorium]|uniref:Uncharacterized protein n=1 Tax=Dinothrombium tinctorium TaxID=1965070 RepID=A0A3S3P6T5_9ACAR|nr:hypothetical protein B4U79_04829 [Dinothrombium tinctorium]RWS07034.1 hypothetical protein B4U79_08437 [Dinothrombium tinctorium]RWS13394.1 hypothetical protein B4U79_09360 [Dinothrombium tinctorium]
MVCSRELSSGQQRQQHQPPENMARNGRVMHSDTVYFNVRCPRAADIHPCTCYEIVKGMETEFVEEETVSQNGSNVTEVEIVFKEEISRAKQPHPDTIETVVFCRNIDNLQVLTEALKGFNGHRVDHFVLDGCKLPPFPTKLFKKINILWMEIVNTNIVLKQSFLNCATDCL